MTTDRWHADEAHQGHAADADASGHDAPRVELAEEVARLTEAVQGWWTSVSAPPQGASAQASTSCDRAEPRREHGGHDEDHRDTDGERSAHPGSCRFCPLCRAVDVARTVRPDLLLHVATAAETVAILLREAVAAEETGAASGRGESKSFEGESTSDSRPFDRMPFDRGTRIVVTDGERTPTGQDDEEGQAP